MSRGAPVSFDANAAAPVLPQAWDAYVEATRHYADPDAPHAAGKAARAALEAAREEVAAAIGARPDEIVFTSGGTEADAAGLLGALVGLKQRGGVPHAVTSRIEHAAVSKTLQLAVERGLATLSTIAVPRGGRGTADALPQADLVSWVLASNETGVVQPVPQMAEVSRSRGALFHTDAVQAVGRMPVNVADLGVDLLSFSGHKLGAVGGVGVLYRRAATPWAPLLTGARENPNVAGAASLAAALRAMPSAAENRALEQLRNSFEATIQANIEALEIIGAHEPRLPNTSSMRFIGCQGDGLLMALDVAGFALSTGSACSSGSVEPSPILLGMGLTAQEALETLRISFGRGTRDEDVAALVQHLTRAARMAVGKRL